MLYARGVRGRQKSPCLVASHVTIREQSIFEAIDDLSTDASWMYLVRHPWMLLGCT
jgi:hypothetical protein